MGKKKIIIVSVITLVLLGFIFIPGYLRIRSLSRQNTKLEQQIRETEQANVNLEKEQERMISDPLYLEEVARKKLGVVRKGEVVYKVLPRED